MTTAKDLMRTTFVQVDINDTAAQLIGKCKKAHSYSALVFEKGKYLGLVDKDFLLARHIDPTEMKIHNAVNKRSKSKTQFFVPTLSTQDDLKTICKKLSSASAHMLPVVEKDKVLGVVHVADVVREVSTEYKTATCDQIASMKPITAKPTDKLSTLLTLFAKGGFDHLPVVDERNEMLGMLTFGDIMKEPNVWDNQSQKLPKAASHQPGKRSGYPSGEKKSVLDLPAQNFMSRKDLCCTPPETKITKAIDQMEQNEVCSIVLVKNNKPVGILTMKDICDDYAK